MVRPLPKIKIKALIYKQGRKSLNKFFMKALPVAIASLTAGSLTTLPVFAEEMEEVVVTGSLIRGTPIDSATNVSVFNRDELDL